MSLKGKGLEELRRSEALSRTVMETVADAVLTIDAGGTVLSVNPTTERVFGYAAAEMLVLTGIRAGVARSLVRLGVGLGGINTRKTLHEGIDCALEYLRRGRGTGA